LFCFTSSNPTFASNSEPNLLKSYSKFDAIVELDEVKQKISLRA